MRRANVGRARVIEFWRAVELFSPQAVPKVSARDRVFRVESDEPLPWEPGHKIQSVRLSERLTWRHMVYGGVFSLVAVRELLEQVFGADPGVLDRMPPGESALLAFSVTAEGRPLLGSQELSGCAWATGRTISPGPSSPDWLNGFDEAVAECDEVFDGLVGALEDDERAAELRDQGHEVGRPIGYDELVEFTAAVADRFGVEERLNPTELRIASVPVSRKAEFAEDTSDFLNSFFISDLAIVAAEVRHGRYGGALDAYLRGSEDPMTAERIDVRRNLDVVYDRVSPDLVPAGRWPKWPLALSQQFAVNTAIAELMDGTGLLAVNGPPGTGKTTMLRDLLAAIVVERARVLAGLVSPEAAFAGTSGWKSGDGYSRKIRLLNPRLTGFEMVVASANNGAVENISLELPLRSEVDVPADYFADLASRVIRKDKDGKPRLGKDGGPVQGWGLMAARLGNKKNRQDFVSSFWFNDHQTGEPGLQEILKDFRAEHDVVDWPAAVAAFRRAEQLVEQLRAERADAYELLSRLPYAEQECVEIDGELVRRDQTRAELLHQIELAAEPARRAAEQLSRDEEVRGRHLLSKPGLVDAVFTWGRVSRDWYAEDLRLAAAETAARQRAEHTQRALAALQRDEAQARGEIARLQAMRHVLVNRVAELRARLDEARTTWGDSFPTGERWRDEQEREKAAPWTDEEWNAARSALFLEALRLHQAFLGAQAEVMTKNLRAAVDILQGAVPQEAPAAAVQAAWQSLFFVVPLVSTTFASFDRVFTHLGSEELGWLFIDEAGQATPQMAVGALWRARRAIVVGDPLQLEPVVTLPFTAQQALRSHFEVSEAWVPESTSVQRLADQTNPYGTYLPYEDDHVWVGAPLRVHRRCDEPMFSISNKVAYDGLMVYDVTDRDKPFPDINPPPPHPPPDSKWIDITSDASEGHWIPAEGAELRRVLTALREKCGIKPSQTFVISPFRDVAARIEKLRKEPDLRGLRGGTIHTAQGKEADVVIFVLGGDPRKPGAKRWAAQKPNLVNVAASRAKRRLYVIGNHREWSKQRHFDILAQRLPRADPVKRDQQGSVNEGRKPD